MSSIIFTIDDAALIAYGKNAGRVIQGECMHHEDKEEGTRRRNGIFNAAYRYAHIEAGDEFFIEAMKNARDLMTNMMSAYQAFDYTELGILMGAALNRQQRILAEQETVRIMNEKQD